MKINGPQSTSAAGTARSGKGVSGAGGFTLGGVAAPGVSGAAPAAGVSAVSSMDALLALQAVEEPGERRRRAVKRAGRILDALDRLKIDLLEGRASPAGLQSLIAAVREERAGSDDPGLQSLLDQIETRAAVELAKLSVRAGSGLAA